VWEIDLSGRTALVSGASRGLGRAIAVGLASAGADVVGLARSSDALEDVRADIESIGRAYFPVPADITDVDSIGQAVEAAWTWRQRLDILVNAAGVIVRSDPPRVTAEEFDMVFDTNVRGTFFLTQAVGDRMLHGDGGSIVTLASIAGEVVTRAAVTYQASKAALIQMSRALGVRWAPTVRVNAVGPGYVRTTLNSAWLDVEDHLQYVRDHTPLDRVGTPDDVVGAVVFLASPAASYITAQHLKVDGGWSAR
jgi:NAD(P)-dependent dehydrogenase (short-subunit alcohol dehydrogenase family)